jgi:hypothetical protein
MSWLKGSSRTHRCYECEAELLQASVGTVGTLVRYRRRTN